MLSVFSIVLFIVWFCTVLSATWLGLPHLGDVQTQLDLDFVLIKFKQKILKISYYLCKMADWGWGEKLFCINFLKFKCKWNATLNSPKKYNLKSINQNIALQQHKWSQTPRSKLPTLNDITGKSTVWLLMPYILPASWTSKFDT